MGGLSRSDFYRILLPGALVIALTDFVLRVLVLIPAPEIEPETAQVVHGLIAFIEDPFRGVAFAFSAGFALYFYDPAYPTTAYKAGLPSDHLEELAEARGYEDVTSAARSVYFELFNEHMPENLRERALLYGAFFRIGVLAILITLLVSVTLPVFALLYSQTSSLGEPLSTRLDPFESPGAVVAVALAAITVLLWWARRATDPYRSSRSSSPPTSRQLIRFLDSPLTTAGVIALLGWGSWLIATYGSIDGQAGQVVVAAGVAFCSLIWLGARLSGPLGSWMKAMVKRVPYYKAQSGFGSFDEFSIDAVFTSVAFVGILAISSALTIYQVIAMLILPLVALGLAFVRKHERQQHGIYSNQRAWISSHWALVDRLLKAQVEAKQDMKANT